MKKKVMSIGIQIFLSRIVDGVAWIVAGIFSLFENIPCTIVCSVALLISIIVTAIVMKAEKEEDDEMSLQHIQAAKAYTQECIHKVIAVIALVLLFVTRMNHGPEINWKLLILPAFYVLLGANDLLVGIKFKKLEEE